MRVLSFLCDSIIPSHCCVLLFPFVFHTAVPRKFPTKLYRNQVNYSKHAFCLDGALMENPQDCTTVLPSLTVTHLFVLAAMLEQCIGQVGSQEEEEERIERTQRMSNCWKALFYWNKYFNNQRMNESGKAILSALNQPIHLTVGCVDNWISHLPWSQMFSIPALVTPIFVISISFPVKATSRKLFFSLLLPVVSWPVTNYRLVYKISLFMWNCFLLMVQNTLQSFLHFPLNNDTAGLPAARGRHFIWAKHLLC